MALMCWAGGAGLPASQVGGLVCPLSCCVAGSAGAKSLRSGVHGWRWHKRWSLSMPPPCPAHRPRSTSARRFRCTATRWACGERCATPAAPRPPRCARAAGCKQACLYSIVLSRTCWPHAERGASIPQRAAMPTGLVPPPLLQQRVVHDWAAAGHDPERRRQRRHPGQQLPRGQPGVSAPQPPGASALHTAASTCTCNGCSHLVPSLPTVPPLAACAGAPAS